MGGTDRDDNTGENVKNTFPEVLAVTPIVLADAVEGADKPAADRQADEDACGGAHPYLVRRSQ